MHLYLHVPYCAAKCPYCDFNSIAGRDHEHAAYVEALLTELKRLPRGPYATIFIGGGTPSLLSVPLLAKLLAGVRDHILLTDDYEWTCEANPGSADGDKFAVMAEHGVNRLSLGVQSTHAHHLHLLGRVHDAAQAHLALDLATAAVPRVSADLIMGLPGQTIAELEVDLGLYRQHRLDHASVYHLAYEPGTEFHARRARGELVEIDAETSHAHFATLWAGLDALGLDLYETSNFARPGHESRHNLAYWRGNDYQAAGAGAVSTVAGIRLTREKHSGRYIDAIMRGEDAAWKTEHLSAPELLTETWMLGLRLVEGVAIEHLRLRGDPDQRWRSKAAALCDLGLLEDTGSHLRLTRAGRPVQDEVTVNLLP